MESIRTPALDDAMRGESISLALVAHELRTPLATLVNAAALLRDVVGGNQAGVAALEMIQRQTRVLTRLVADLMDTTRIETGQLSATFELIDLKEALRWAAESCEPALRTRDQHFETLVYDAPLLVTADRERMVQVFVNLLDNAIKYTPRGGTISLIAGVDDRDVVVRVRDTGVGMSASTVPHVFELFSQAPSTKSMAQGGVGIGLALVRGIVALHDGCVEARSAGLGLGSEFTVRLPFHVQSSCSKAAIRASDLGMSTRSAITSRSPRGTDDPRSPHSRPRRERACRAVTAEFVASPAA